MATDINQLMFNEAIAQRTNALDALVQVGAQLAKAKEETAAALERAQIAEKELEELRAAKPTKTTAKTKA